MNNHHHSSTAGFPPPHPAAAAVNGYPYAAQPPRPAYYYTNYNHEQANPNPYYDNGYASHRATFFRRFVSAIIAVLLILTSILFIVWLVLRPRVPEFRINSLSVSHLNATSSQIFGNWSADLSVLNPNTKMHAYYELLESYAYYKSDLLAQNRLPPFDQATRSLTNLTATMVAAQTYVDDWVVTGVNSDRSHGSVKFDVRIAAVVHFQARGWRTRRRLLRVFCDGLPVAISGKARSGVLTGGPRNCLVSL